jgi:hypothetical protein
MDVDEEEEPAPQVEEEKPTVWGMPRWGCENERGGEVRPGVRLVGMEEVSVVIVITTVLTRYSYLA